MYVDVYIYVCVCGYIYISVDIYACIYMRVCGVRAWVNLHGMYSEGGGWREVPVG